MNISIIIDTEAELSANDRAVLLAIAGETGTTTAAAAETADKAAAPAAKKAAPAAKKAAAKPAPKAKPAPVEEEPEEAEEVDVDETDDDEDGPTMDKAVAMATKLVSEDRAAEVKAALNSVGAKRVSDIPDEKLGDFLAELS